MHLRNETSTEVYSLKILLISAFDVARVGWIYLTTV